MAAKPTLVYPVKNRYLNDVPAVVQTIASKAEADALVASGAFTYNPRDPERDTDAPDYESLDRAEDGDKADPVSHADVAPVEALIEENE
jgi:hypothetical protein